MNRLLKLLAVFVFLFNHNILHAQDNDSDDHVDFEEQMARLTELGPGVHAVQKNKNGNILSCVVVGQSRISTSLGKTKGLELARDKANIACAAEFVKWIKEEVTVVQSSDSESISLMEGEESEAFESLRESGKSIERSSKRLEAVSKGLVRGLQLLHKSVNGEEKTYTVIKGWRADNAEGVKKVASDMASDNPKGSDDGKASNKPSENAKRSRIDKEIESGSVTSEEAADYFPKRKKK